MTGLQQFDAEGIEARRFEYENAVVVAADFGTAEATVDVVGGTAIVVVDDEQYEFDVGPEADVRINNGVLTIEVGA